MRKQSFHQELVLNQWMMSFFRGGSLEAIKLRLGEERHEGVAEDGQTGFFHELHHNLFQIDRIPIEDMRKYDLNIIRHWQRITKQRSQLENTVLNMKYFQYLSLLFTEIYLDWYFNRRQQLLNDLNEQVTGYNATQERENHFKPYDADDLNKLAYWNATGSGKTLLLHINILQYLHYFQSGHPNSHPDKIILLTPNEGLSRQHLDELQLSGFGFSRLFDKNRTTTVKGLIEVVDINKLSDEMGEKTVAVDAFEGSNLVLVDEGHRGTGTAAGAWMSRREALIRGGFAFEYSATFGQAVAKGWTILKSEEDLIKKKAKMLFDTANLRRLSDEQRNQLTLNNSEKRRARALAVRETYAKCILFDYSYKFFYEDGYGKESLILNLKDEDFENRDTASIYFLACLLSFYQQQFLWHTNADKLIEFNIERPLWIFVGNTVAGEDADILNVVRFFAQFVNDEQQIKQWLEDLLQNKARLLDTKGRNIFHDRFTPLMQRSANEIYSDILRRLFNANSRQRLKITNIKASKGELTLRIGDAYPFGLINIGDDAGFFKETEKHENMTLFDTEEDEFGESIFNKINAKDSNFHVLIGSRKFIEGWSSWRVSTMGLLNMGKGEGSQIIQLFGRGVRLKGKEYSLKRTPVNQRPKGVHLEMLETLSIFGINAGYMATFKDYLKDEGITPSDEILELDFETATRLPPTELKTLILKDGYKDNQIKGFKRTHFPWLYEIPEEFRGKIKEPHVELDLYPQLEAISSKTRGTPKSSVRQKGKIATETMAFFDFEEIYLAVQSFKQLNHWSNLRVDRLRLMDFCKSQNHWYTLYIPHSELEINRIDDIRKQQDILIRLLEDYTDRFYRTLKSAYEKQFYELAMVKKNDECLLKMYHFEINPTEEGQEYEERLRSLQSLVRSGKLGEVGGWSAGQMVAICFDRHLYYPLFALEGAVPLKMRPLSFDAPGEYQFVRDLQSFFESKDGQETIQGRSLYFLRNAGNKAKGLGFALAGNFYPDFLLWLVDEVSGEQWLSFIDPKGLRQLDLSDPKLGLYKEVKSIQQNLADPKLTLNAFILSVTPFPNLLNVSCSQSDLEDRNVLFMSDSGPIYLKKMFERILRETSNISSSQLN